MVWTEERAGRYWRWQARFPDQYFTHRFGHLIARKLHPLLAGRRSVLDFGCGVGFLERHLAALGLTVTATDHSPEAVAATNARNHGVANFAGAHTIDALRRDGRTFDAIVSIEVIEHLTDEHLAQYFDALAALLAPGGVAVITTPNEEDLAAAETYCPSCDHVFHRWQHLRVWTAASLEATVSLHGLKAERAFATDFARDPRRDPVGALKNVVKRLLGRPVAAPHLVCIARHPG